MNLQVTDLNELEQRVWNALDRIGELQAGTRVQSDVFFLQQFMRDHTEFDSFAAFCNQSPWPLDDIGDVQDIPRELLNEYVGANTDFETWEGMKTQAAEEKIIDQIVSRRSHAGNYGQEMVQPIADEARNKHRTDSGTDRDANFSQ